MEANRLALAHGAYFLATGAWPLVHLRSFEKVTGPKPSQRWLVKTVGALALAVGSVLTAHARHRPSHRALRSLAIQTGMAFFLSDLWYVARRRISPTYLLDALAQAGFLLAWIGRSPGSPPKNRDTRPVPG